MLFILGILPRVSVQGAHAVSQAQLVSRFWWHAVEAGFGSVTLPDFQATFQKRREKLNPNKS
ncbi:hypothetical protein [Vibrio methylphosphonaticus]|uniref:hypothetical protein n=1 Tax=Vibrio methylphosphonaticus TaxID=2946866 RepID=UPI002029E81D|nr:hypothetical protein [Vibrio methylphosphonaticus]MCL9774010.1 hypothetical protein [Vibrio methylphosphonaticus]